VRPRHQGRTATIERVSVTGQPVTAADERDDLVATVDQLLEVRRQTCDRAGWGRNPIAKLCDPWEDRAMGEFEGFGPAVHKWFKGLEENNSREYFAANRDFFEESIRDQMEALLTELSAKFGGDVKMFRQNRDIRFSADKSPYKTNTYGVLRGSDMAAEGLYASISADGLVAGSGYHMMARDQLDRYREGVADEERGAELSKLVAKAQKAGLELWGESLATAPRGYPKDHERIELLRRKSLSLGATLKSKRRMGRTDGLRFVTETWRAAAPVTGWLDEHVGASTMPLDRGRRGR
jgi:uncharacterized protein (TIGR02453 family)